MREDLIAVMTINPIGVGRDPAQKILAGKRAQAQDWLQLGQHIYTGHLG